MNLALHPITPDLVAPLLAAGKADGGHHAPGATHVFLSDLEIVGSAGLFCQTFTFWAKSTGLPKRAAVTMAQLARDEAIRLSDGRHFMICCAKDSPYHPLMAGLGFERLGNADYFQLQR